MANPPSRDNRTTLQIGTGTAARFRLAKEMSSARAGHGLTNDEFMRGLLDLLDTHVAQVHATRKAAG